MKSLIRRVIGPALALLVGAAFGVGKPPEELVAVQRGTLPIVLTAPHGGREAIPGVPIRDPKRSPSHGGRAWGDVRTGSDFNTDVLTLRIAEEVRALTGKAPYVVVAKFHRRHVDVNRPPRLAMDSDAARPYYDHYHQAIRRFVDEVRTTYPAGILLDVHGQAKDPGALMRGTLNGRSVERLIRRAGVDGITGPKGLFGLLEQHGFRVFPANHVPPRGNSEDAGFNGGYTVHAYGSRNSAGIDALQLEFGSDYRRSAVLDATASNAARAIVAFYEAYLKK